MVLCHPVHILHMNMIIHTYMYISIYIMYIYIHIYTYIYMKYVFYRALLWKRPIIYTYIYVYKYIHYVYIHAWPDIIRNIVIDLVKHLIPIGHMQHRVERAWRLALKKKKCGGKDILLFTRIKVNRRTRWSGVYTLVYHWDIYPFARTTERYCCLFASN